MSIAEHDAEHQIFKLIKQGEQQAAIAIAGEALSQEPENAGLWMLSAIARHSLADWHAALADAETAMTLMPLPIGGQLVLADCYAHTGRPELAVMGYQHLLTLGPLPSDLYAGIYAGLRKCGRHRLAITACRAALEADPDNHAAYFGMAHCMAALNYSSAYIASVLRSAVELAPDVTAYRTSLAIQLVRDGKPTQAHAELSHVPDDDLRSVECLCSAKKLMQLCIWADDLARTKALGEAVRRLAKRREGEDPS